MSTKLTIPALLPLDAPAAHRRQNLALRASNAQHNARIDAAERMERAKALAGSARQAITTSYRGPTDARGSRVIARCEAKRISVPWDHEAKRISVPWDHALDIGANHAAAALQLMDQLGWSEKNDLVMGGTRDGYVFVQVPKRV